MTTLIVSIGDVAVLNPKHPPLAGEDGTLVPFIPMAAVREDGRDPQEQYRPLAELTTGYTYFERGDILLAKITPCFENGKAAHLDSLSHPFGFGSTEYHVLRAGPEIDSRYLFQVVRDSRFRLAGASSMTGSAGQQRVSAGFVAGFRIPLPPLAGQRRIAAMLEKVDVIRRKRRETLRLLDELLRSLFLEMFGDPVRNDKRWPSMTLGELLPQRHLLVDGPFGSTLKPDSYVAAGVRVIRNFNIKDDAFDGSAFKFITEEKFDQVKRSEVRAGDVLISTKGTLGNVCLMPELAGRSVLSATGTVRMRLPQESKLRRQFLVSLMTMPPYKQHVKRFEAGTNQKYLNLAAIRKLSVVLPPTELQDGFVEVRDRIAALKSRLTVAADVSDSLFTSLARQWFT